MSAGFGKRYAGKNIKQQEMSFVESSISLKDLKNL